MEPTWSSLVIVIAIVAVCSAAAAVWGELEARHRRRRQDSVRAAAEAAPAAQPLVSSDSVIRGEVLHDVLERMTQPGALTSTVDVSLDIATPCPAESAASAAAPVSSTRPTPPTPPAPRRAAARHAAIHAREWDETVPMVALSGVLPHELNRDSVGVPVESSDHHR